MKTFFSDRRGKHTSKEFEDCLDHKGTKHKLTVHDTHEQDRVTECLNHTLVERTRAMLLGSNLLKNLWDYAILHAKYIKNCMHTHSLPDKTPYEMVYSEKPNLHDTYEGGKELYIKIKQDDKLAH